MENKLRSTLRDGKFNRLTIERSRIMRSVKSRGNKTTELRLRAALVQKGIVGWKINPKGILGSPDFFVPRARLAIFVDGCFWHGCLRCGHVPNNNRSFWQVKLSNNRKRDGKINRQLREQGITVFRFWEHQLKIDLQACVRRINKHVRSSSR